MGLPSRARIRASLRVRPTLFRRPLGRMLDCWERRCCLTLRLARCENYGCEASPAGDLRTRHPSAQSLSLGGVGYGKPHIESHYPTQAKVRLEWGTQHFLPVWQKLWWGFARLVRPRYAEANLGHPS